MNKNQLNLLEKRTIEIGEALYAWKDSMDKDKKVSMKEFVEKNGLPLPNQITEQGKGNINISLHKSSFNNRNVNHVLIKNGKIKKIDLESFYENKVISNIVIMSGLQYSICSC